MGQNFLSYVFGHSKRHFLSFPPFFSMFEEIAFEMKTFEFLLQLLSSNDVFQEEDFLMHRFKRNSNTFIIKEFIEHFWERGVCYVCIVSPLLVLSLFIVNHQLSSRDFNTLGHLQPATFLLQLEAKSFINQSLIWWFMNIMNIAENYHIPVSRLS